MCSEIPHRELGKKLIRIRARVGFIPKTIVQRFAILFVKPLANVSGHSVLPDVVGELMHTNIALCNGPYRVLAGFPRHMRSVNHQVPASADRRSIHDTPPAFSLSNADV